MHSAKGLEWPIVIVVNGCSDMKAHQGAVLTRQDGHSTLSCPVLGTRPQDYEAALQAEQDAIDHERVRVWYVGATRAKELLVVPRFAAPKGWLEVVNFDLTKLNDFPVGTPSPLPVGNSVTNNAQTKVIFGQENQRITSQTRSVTFVAPSRSEVPAVAVDLAEDATGDEEDETVAALTPVALNEDASTVQGGLFRGLVMHKLFEEILTGETSGTLEDLARRGDELLAELGSGNAFSGSEIAGCVIAALALPQVAAVRPKLQPEWAVYAIASSADEDIVTYGIADALAVDPDGTIDLVVDWKSDSDPDEATIAGYREQVRAYLVATGAKMGLIVLATKGLVVEVVV